MRKGIENRYHSPDKKGKLLILLHIYYIIKVKLMGKLHKYHLERVGSCHPEFWQCQTTWIVATHHSNPISFNYSIKAGMCHTWATLRGNFWSFNVWIILDRYHKTNEKIAQFPHGERHSVEGLMEKEIFCQEINWIKVPLKKIPQMQEMPNSYGVWLELEGGGGLQHEKEFTCESSGW